MDSKEIKTKDADEAAFLWCQNEIDFDRAEPSDKGQGAYTVFFVFVTSLSESGKSDLRRKYYNQMATVEPKQFAQRQVDIRNILHSVLRERKKEKVSNG